MENLAKLTSTWKDSVSVIFNPLDISVFPNFFILDKLDFRFSPAHIRYSFYERHRVTQWWRASRWPQEGHGKEDKVWLTQGGFNNDLLAVRSSSWIGNHTFIFHVCVSHQVLYTPFFQRYSELELTFPAEYNKLCLVKPLPEALSAWLPPHILSWLYLPFLAIPSGSRLLPCPCSAADPLWTFLNCLMTLFIVSLPSLTQATHLSYTTCQHYG